uniref:Uncharacterized protein n=1 Tax=Anguilla anguilla TaxID=7936 RepID=A0A0E9VLU6_ANGAN
MLTNTKFVQQYQLKLARLDYLNVTHFSFMF